MRTPATLLAGVLLALSATNVAAGPRVYSLDQCADQYVLALAPRADIVGLSKRADDADSYMRAGARGLPLRRATAESVLAARPDIVVRTWGGEANLAEALRRRGVRVVQIEDATDFAGIARETRRVAAALGQPAAGEALVRRMDGELAASAGAWRGAGALYLTPGGFTAGGGTLIDAILRGAGLSNLAGGEGFRSVSLERLVLEPPHAIVEGFFEAVYSALQRWSPGRHQVLRRIAERRTLVSLPGRLVGCPAWYSADATARIAAAAPKRGLSARPD
ncbi:MAG TPA: ABC transporter substrate-binding protein [Caulobacteraceae bacterium]|nr:ABC transporter substrate-binding protein [Caulobacteraceae bacterium]